LGRDTLLPHNPHWRSDFEAEAGALRQRFGAALSAIHHIGSTAIPDIVAKPIIDILIETTSLAAIDERNAAMEAAGYQARGAFGIEGRRYFKKVGAPPAGPGFHVHVYEADSPHIVRHLHFRDYLLAKPQVAHAYSALKLSLCDAAGALPADYVSLKAGMVAQIERDALAFFSATPPTS
jgi:GrpB-like predicted nucleotidyltransferase (UPF0157 family)